VQAERDDRCHQLSSSLAASVAEAQRARFDLQQEKTMSQELQKQLKDSQAEASQASLHNQHNKEELQRLQSQLAHQSNARDALSLQVGELQQAVSNKALECDRQAQQCACERADLFAARQEIDRVRGILSKRDDRVAELANGTTVIEAQRMDAQLRRDAAQADLNKAQVCPS
jgi:chromosome segregation ATPase